MLRNKFRLSSSLRSHFNCEQKENSTTFNKKLNSSRLSSNEFLFCCLKLFNSREEEKNCTRKFNSTQLVFKLTLMICFEFIFLLLLQQQNKNFSLLKNLNLKNKENEFFYSNSFYCKKKFFVR